MRPADVSAVSTELEQTLALVHELVTELNRLESRVADGRVREILDRLGARADLDRLPETLLRVYQEVVEALHGIRAGRETIRAFSIDRLHDTTARLSEVSSTTESAATEMLNGLDRTLAMVDRAQSATGAEASAAFDAVRNEVNSLYGHLQFQDIISQQLAGVTALLGDLEARMEAIAALFDRPGAAAPDALRFAPALPDPAAYNADASMHDAAGRQTLIDAAFSAARR